MNNSQKTHISSTNKAASLLRKLLWTQRNGISDGKRSVVYPVIVKAGVQFSLLSLSPEIKISKENNVRTMTRRLLAVASEELKENVRKWCGVATEHLDLVVRVPLRRIKSAEGGGGGGRKSVELTQCNKKHPYWKFHHAKASQSTTSNRVR